MARYQLEIVIDALIKWEAHPRPTNIETGHVYMNLYISDACYKR